MTISFQWGYMPPLSFPYWTQQIVSVYPFPAVAMKLLVALTPGLRMCVCVGGWAPLPLPMKRNGHLDRPSSPDPKSLSKTNMQCSCALGPTRKAKTSTLSIRTSGATTAPSKSQVQAHLAPIVLKMSLNLLLGQINGKNEIPW